MHIRSGPVDRNFLKFWTVDRTGYIWTGTGIRVKTWTETRTGPGPTVI
ncbi:unnamed protein product [Rhodiola kirilowii]